MSPETDPASILEGLGIRDVTTIERVLGGADTIIWRIERNGTPYALRVFRPEQKATFEKEQSVMWAASAAGLSVPAVHAAGIVQNHPALLLSWMSGQPLTRQLFSHPAQVWKLGTAFGRMQAAIHNTPIAPEGVSEGWIEWAGQDESLLQERLRALPDKRTALLHLDYHPLNVMTDGQQITAVLDWANARLGDPRADFARTYTILRLDPSDVSLPYYIHFFRILFERAWRDGYVQVAEKPEDMALFYAWAGVVMVRDLSPRIGKPGVAMQDHHLNPVRRWTAHWKRQAGIT